MPDDTALVPTASSALVRMDDAPMTVLDFERDVLRHRDAIGTVVRLYADAFVTFGQKQHPTKVVYQALARFANLSIELVDERRAVYDQFDDGRDNAGWHLTVRISNGRRAVTGEGACFAVEKASSFRCPHTVEGRANWSEHFPHETCPDFDPAYRWRVLPEEATDHNLHATAYTRAVNRGVDLFLCLGNVSAEEVEAPSSPPRRERSDSAPRRAAPVARPGGPAIISSGQLKRFWAIVHEHRWSDAAMRAVIATHGFESTSHITTDKYDAIITTLEKGPPPANGAAS